MAEMGAFTVRDPLPSPALTNTRHEQTLDGEAWKHRPPYQIQDLNEFGEIKWRAHCECGKVKYSLKRDQPLNAKFCHCRGCQVMHGAPFQWCSIFHKEDVRFDEGASNLTFYSATHRTREYETPTKVYCSFCRTPIMDEGRNVCLLFPQLIEFRGSPDEQRKQQEIFKPKYGLCRPKCELSLTCMADATSFMKTA